MRLNVTGQATVWTLGLLLAGPAQVHAQAEPQPQPQPQPQPLANTAAQRVTVTGFAITGNTLLPLAGLMATLDRFKGERTLDELKRAAFAVQEKYREAGFSGVIAYVPPQSAVNGVATIAVLEGRLKFVEVIGNKQFSEANILRSLPLLAPGLTPQVPRLDAQIQLANEHPSKKVAVLLEAGAQQGEVQAHITVTEAPVQRWVASLDNTGNAATGRWRASLSYLHSALWQLDHQLSLQFQFAPEKPSAVAVFSASYRVPFHAQGMTLDAYAAHSNVDGGSTASAAGAVQFSGKGVVLGTKLTKYLRRWGEVDQRVALGFDRRAYINACSVAGLPAGACGAAGESVTVHPLALEYTAQRAGAMPVGVNVSVARNLGLGGAHGSDANFDAVRPGAKRKYTQLRASLTGDLALPQRWLAQLRVSGQFSRDALVSGEQFGLGGAYSVRGYAEREMLGDSGVAGSAEIYTPELSRLKTGVGADASSSARLLAFVDAGHVRNRLGTPCFDAATRCGLASVGVGLRAATGTWQFRLDLAQALRDAQRTKRHDFGASFQVVYSFI